MLSAITVPAAFLKVRTRLLSISVAVMPDQYTPLFTEVGVYMYSPSSFGFIKFTSPWGVTLIARTAKVPVLFFIAVPDSGRR